MILSFLRKCNPYHVFFSLRFFVSRHADRQVPQRKSSLRIVIANLIFTCFLASFRFQICLDATRSTSENKKERAVISFYANLTFNLCYLYNKITLHSFSLLHCWSLFRS
jgi:hypothetical protein